MFNFIVAPGLKSSPIVSRFNLIPVFSWSGYSFAFSPDSTMFAVGESGFRVTLTTFLGDGKATRECLQLSREKHKAGGSLSIQRLLIIIIYLIAFVFFFIIICDFFGAQSFAVALCSPWCSATTVRCWPAALRTEVFACGTYLMLPVARSSMPILA